MKTRLHACCSPQQAADLYRAFILDSAELLQRCDAEAKVVAHDPPEAAAQVRALLSLLAAAPEAKAWISLACNSVAHGRTRTHTSSTNPVGGK